MFFGLSGGLQSADWRSDMFREGQEIMLDLDKKEARAVIAIAPNTAEFYKLWLAMKEARQKVEILAFSYQIKNNKYIDWSNPWKWLDALSSSSEEKSLFEENIEFKAAYAAYMEKRRELYSRPELFKERNRVFSANRKELGCLDEELKDRLEALQKSVEKNLQNEHAAQPSQ